MKNKNQGTSSKVVRIEKVRKEREGKGLIIKLLKDTRKVALAIQNKTCLLCRTQKLCVNKTGLCASCYDNLIPEEKKTAIREAQHKIIEVKVTDDRWDNEKDS